MELYRIIKEVGVYGSFDVAMTRGLTPFVGRENEAQELIKCWKQIKNREGQVAIVAGEAGLGKSRLIEVFKEQIKHEPHTWMVCHCSSYYQNSAFYSIIDLLKRRLEFDPNESESEKLAKLEDAMSRFGFDPDEVIPLFAPLLSLTVPEKYPPLTMTPQKQKEKTLEAILGWLLQLSAEAPVVFLVENLQWSDPSTLEALSLIMEHVSKARILILLAFRPETEIPREAGSKLIEIILNRLSANEIAAMAEMVAGGKSLPKELLEQIVLKTDGVPLFIEELTKMVLESGFITEKSGRYHLSMPLSDLSIPTTLQDSLMARLDQLGTVKDVIQLAATLGREFSYELIKAVSPVDDRVLKRELEKLVEAELLRRCDIQSEIRYSFNQALIQDAAYHSLLRKTRQKYHKEIALAIEKDFAEIRETQPEILAHHFTEAGLKTEAISYWLEAGKMASRKSANLEAINHLTRGLDLIQSMPESPERDRHELPLQIALGVPMTATKGFASKNVEKAYARARELCNQIGETPQLFPVLRGLWLFHMVRTELRTAKDLGNQLIRLGEEAKETGLILQGHLSLGLTNFYLGEFETALKHMEHGIRLYDKKEHHTMAYTYGENPGVVCLSYSALTLWMLGHFEKAVQRDQETLMLADEISHPFSQALAFNFSARFHQCRGDVQTVKEMAEATISISSMRGFTHWIPTGNIFKGWALSCEGHSEEGIALIREGISDWQATGASVSGPHYQAMLAEAYWQNGEIEVGIEVIKEGLANVESCDERLYVPELHRLKGELLLAPGEDHLSEAEECFREALNMSEIQKATPLELNAAVSLSRLLIKQGRSQEAKEILKKSSIGVEKGGDTPKIREAMILLGELP
jgi:predicted ATPase